MCLALSWSSRGTWQLTTEQLRWKKLGHQRRMLDERAITDVAMTVLNLMSPGRAWATLFRQTDEAVTGADFELLVFDGRGRYLAFLVQAKSMKASTGESYSGVRARVAGLGPNRPMQYDRLLASCSQRSARPNHTALHVFYNGQRLASGRDWPEDQCRSTCATDEQARGITVVNTHVLAATCERRPVRYTVDRVAPVCWPWWCFFCCGIAGLEDLAARAVDAPPGLSGGEPPEIGTVDAAPAYVRWAAAQRDGGAGDEAGAHLRADDVRPGAEAVLSLELGSGEAAEIG